MSESVLLEYIPLVGQNGSISSDRIACLSINRPESANAFSGDILVEMTKKIHDVKQDTSIRVLLLQSVGKHFSAGADLGWMKESAVAGYEKNLDEAAKLTSMFESLNHLDVPTVAVCKGAAYGGAVGLAAVCDYTLATETARFCLSETNVGLLPAVILPYLSRKIPLGILKRWTLSGQVVPSHEALGAGLVQRVIPTQDMESELRTEINHLLSSSPEAQKSYKHLQLEIDRNNCMQGHYTAEAIANVRASDSGQEGLSSFFEKRKPGWVVTVKDDLQLFKAP